MSNHVRLLLVEDNDGLREQMKWALNDSFDVFEADSSASCMSQFEMRSPQIVCLDMGLDNEPLKGLELIDSILEMDRYAKIIVITAQTSETVGSDAVAKGAFDFLKKPIDIDELRVILNRAVRLVSLEEPALEQTRGGGLEITPDFNMIGESDQMKRIFGIIERLAKTEVSVLIAGESGTGKEICAHAIHFHSNRRDRPFVPINCSAIPETLLESELFGYVKGAFTGANSDKVGLVESAEGGTLFLDEIGDMPETLQVKLLRFLEDKKYQRVGDTHQKLADVRVLAATNQKDENGAIGGIRNDLYYRLSEFEIHLPPLRERGKDILILASKLIETDRVKFSLPKLALSTRAEKVLLMYSWPGNVRELENKLSRAAIACEKQIIEPEDLQLSVTSMTGLAFKEARAMFEREYLLKCLHDADGKIALAARTAGISRPTFYDLMKKHGIVTKVETKIVLE